MANEMDELEKFLKVPPGEGNPSNGHLANGNTSSREVRVPNYISKFIIKVWKCAIEYITRFMKLSKSTFILDISPF